ncbi:MAG TPA: hypothetical protein GXX61_06300 [Bacteroidales bacterium]|nr:hypothetical protein [Bacteroidales bacterium]
MKPFHFLKITLCALTAFLFLSCLQDKPYISYKDTIEDMDITQFLGTMYEVAQLGRPKKEQVAQVLYKSSSDSKGSIQFTVEKTKYTIYGPVQIRKGVLRWNEDFPGVLRVSFYLNFYKDYYILYLADDYSVCLISNDSASRLWILAKNIDIKNEDFIAIDEKITELGFDKSKIYWTEDIF